MCQAGEGQRGLRGLAIGEIQRAWDLLEPLTAGRFVSVRADQSADALRARYPQARDALPDAGPAAGILAAYIEALASGTPAMTSASATAAR